MGNACTIQSTSTLQFQRISPNPSLVFPPAPEILETIHSNQKGDGLSQANDQSAPTSGITIPTLNGAKSFKRPVYSIDKQNLSKAIQGQISPTKKTGNKSAFTFGKLPITGYQLSKEKWSKESSFVRQNPPSFHASVSEIYDDGCMEYSRDSESLKVEDLWQDASRSINSEFQRGLGQNFEDRRRSEGYSAMHEGYLSKYFNGDDYRRGSIEVYGQGDTSPPKKNLKKEEVRMFQVRLEKEESVNKLSLFAKADKDVPINDKKDTPVNLPLRTDTDYNPCADDKSPQLDKELRMVQGLTAIAESFSPIKKSRNATPEPENKSPIGIDENPFREEKSLYSGNTTPFELSPMKIQHNQNSSSVEHYHSASKASSQTGLKPLVKYCSVGAFESALVTGLYEGVEGLSQNNGSILEKSENKQKDPAQEQNKYESNPRNMFIADKTYASVRSSTASRESMYSSENYVDNSDKTKKEPRRSSLMDRLMESLLEDKYKQDENKVILESVDKESPLPSVRRDPLEKERRNYGKNRPENNSRQSYIADQSQSFYSVKTKPPVMSQDNTSNKSFQEKSIILQEVEMSKDMNRVPRQDQFKKDSETHNSLASSAYVSHRTSPQLRSDILDFSKEYILSQMEEAQKAIKGRDVRASRGEIITDQKAIVQEIKNLQKEVFERMSVVTSNMKGKMLTPKKMLELRDIQDKIQILTQLGSMIEAKEAKEGKKEIAAVAKNNKSTQNSRETSIQSKMSQQMSNRSTSKEAKNYFSCSKPSSTSSQGIKRNSSVSNINTNITNKSAYTSSKNNISTENDSSMIKPPSGGPSNSQSTQEFLESEIECIQNPKEVWKRQNDNVNQKSYKSLPWASEYKSLQRPVETNAAKELSHYQTVEPKPRRVTEVLSTSKSYLANDLSVDNSCTLPKQVLPSGKESLRQSADLKDPGANGIHSMIKKLSYAKNLSTYATSYASQQKEASRNLTPEPSVKNIKQPIAAARRQSAIGEKTESRRTSVGQKELSKSRVSSIEKIKPNPPAQGLTNKNEGQLKHQTSNKRLSVGSSSTTVKEYSIDLTNYRGKSPLPKSYAENEKKRKINQVSQIQEIVQNVENAENVENIEIVPEIATVEENVISVSELETDQAEQLCEEITKLDQKLAVTKSSSKIAVIEDIVEKSPNKRTRTSDVGLDKGNKKGSYIKQAIKKTERHMTPLVGRVNRQNPNQASEIQERRQTIANLSVQQEQMDVQTTEQSCTDGKKGKYDYAMQMRIKYAEEAARKQSMVESTEWIFSAKLPIYAGKIQDKLKKN